MSYLSAAVELADTTETAAAASSMVGSCRAAGLDVNGYRGLIGTALNLGVRPTGPGRPWRNDAQFIDAVVDLEDEIHTRLFRIRSMKDQLIAMLDTIPATEENAHIISNILAATEVLEAADLRIGYALGRLRAVPGELGDTYAAAYRLVRAGRKLPYNGRWITGSVA